jgi:pilus assembly protein Flp/PilA
MEKITRFMKEEEGVTLIEYGLIAALIAVALIATLTSVKDGLVSLFSTVATKVTQ